MTSQRRVLVLGATGVVGHAAAARFLSDAAFDVVTVSRRDPTFPDREGYTHVDVDLRDADAVADAMRGVGPVTHVVYAALFEKADLIAGWVEQDQIDANLLMLKNVLDGLRFARAPLVHVSILQGTKAYGYHIGRMRIPGKESQPRVAHDNFYWAQEDLLLAVTREISAAYTIFRPQFVFGDVLGAAMNLIPVIGVYAALCREIGRPFSFPGGAPYVAEATDSRLLADALHWAASSSKAANETFNITNGDVFEWRDLWPALASTMDVEPGPDEPLSMTQWLPSQEETWRRVVDRHRLRSLRLSDILGLSHQYADDAFAYTEDGSALESRAYPVLLSTIKLRKAGFGDCVDTEQMFASWLRKLRADRVLP